MKKLILLSIGLLAASSAFAQTATTRCASGAPQNNGIYSFSANSFVVRDFQFKCSNNVQVSTAETAVAFGVGSLSIKGKSRFLGTTGGGAINGTACGTTCNAGDEQTGLVAAVNAAT